MKYAGILHFNGRIGGKSILAETIEAESVGDALDTLINKAVRSKAGGGSIYVTGITIVEVPGS